MGDEGSYSVSPPGHPGRKSSLRLWVSWSPYRQSEDSVSASDQSFDPSSHCIGWRGAEVLLHDPCQLKQFNQTGRFRKPSGVSRSARVWAQTLFRTGPSNISQRERYPFWSWHSKRSSSPSTSLQHGSMLEWSLYLNRGNIQHCPHPIGQLVSSTWLLNYLKRSYYLGSYMT